MFYEFQRTSIKFSGADLQVVLYEPKDILVYMFIWQITLSKEHPRIAKKHFVFARIGRIIPEKVLNEEKHVTFDEQIVEK